MLAISNSERRYERGDIPYLVVLQLPINNAICANRSVSDIGLSRSETFEQPFYEYNIPEAILTFRQGFGRLIRTQFDRGIVAVLDRRVLTKQYGRLFIESLPQCTLEVGPVQDLPRAAQQWLGI